MCRFPKMMNLFQHSSLIVSMNLSQRPLRLGLAFGNGFVLTLALTSVYLNSLVNFVSRSCMTMAGFSILPAVSSRNRFV